MDIIIIGCGKVGTELIGNLVAEGHNIVAVDKSKSAVEAMENSYDVRGVCGHGASIATLREAGAEKGKEGLVIAVTGSDELNILCCLTAKMLGTPHSIARVRDSEYAKQLDFVRNELGISMLINPEFETANEIARVLRFPSALKIDTFAKGRIDLAEIKLTENSVIIGKPLRNMNFRNKILICAVQRRGEVFIPNGNFIPQAGDRLHFTASHSHLDGFFKENRMFKKPIRNVMIVGGGRIAFYLAQQLLELGMEVKIIESDAERAVEIDYELPGAVVINGDGTDQSLLIAEGIDRVDAFIPLTGIDEENIILTVFAESRQVDKVVLKINRINFYDILSRLGIDSVISPRKITANLILRYVRAKQNSSDRGVVTLYKIVNESIEALEMRVSENSAVINKALRDLKIRPNVLIACIVHGNKIIYPGGDDMIKAGDNVIIVTADSTLNDIDDILI